MMRVKLLAALPLMSFLISAPLLPKEGRAELLFVGDFEAGSLRGIQTEACAPQTLQVVSSPVRSGQYAVESSVHGSDPGCWPHHRAEVSPKACHAKPDKQYWYGWSTYVPRDWSDDPGWVLLTQWHAHRAMQPLQLNVHGSTLQWQRWYGFGVKRGGPGSAKLSALWSGKLDNYKGKWTDWVAHVKWAENDDGYITIWANGKKIVDYHGVTLTPGDGAPYWKAGLVYDAKNGHDHTLFIDEMRMGDADSSFQEVAPPHRAYGDNRRHDSDDSDDERPSAHRRD